ncbi:MAG: peptide ABC transporter substrate-binding protein, partial [Burkholderiales bacterium]
MKPVRPARRARLAGAVLATLAIPALFAAGPLAAKTLVYCSEGSPENFYPAVNTTGTSFDANSQIYSRIVDFERGGTSVVPGLAQKWEISPDGTVYTFHLRKGVKWHNHRDWKPTRDLNADDIIFSIERQWKESNPYFKVTSSNHSYFNDMGLPKLLKSVEKVDDYTVRITLNRPEAPFLSDLAMEYAGIQSKEYADAMLKAGTPEKIDQEPIGTGPYYLVRYIKDAIIRYKAFPQFWGGKAKIDDLIFAITPDASVRWAKLQKGECHVMPYPNPADLEAMRKDPNVKVLEQPGLNVGYLAYNTQKKPFDDVRVRKAVNMAINKKAIIDAVYLSAGIPATNPIPPTMWSYNKSIKDDPYDPAAAKKLLAEAGFPNGFTTDLWAMPVQRPYNPNARRIAELMQADLAKVGIKAEIKSFEWGEYRKRMQA